MSTFKDIPIQMASKSFLYLLMNNAIFAKKYRSRFLLNAAINHIDDFRIVEVTIDVSTIVDVKSNPLKEIKCKRIANKITDLRFIGIKNKNRQKWLIRRKNQKSFRNRFLSNTLTSGCALGSMAKNMIKDVAHKY